MTLSKTLAKTPAKTLAGALVVSLVAAAAFAQDHSGHHGSTTPGQHEGHGRSAAPGAADAWSYVGRDNPKPVTRNRWVMVPGESGAMYRSAKGMSAAERCRALLASPRIIVDESTRTACGEAGAAPIPAAPSHTDHSQHR